MARQAACVASMDGPATLPPRSATMDALSDLLKSVRIEGAVYLNAEFTAPWCIWSSFGSSSISERLGRTDEILFFHFITEGQCKLQVSSIDDVIEARAGDVIVFPRNERHLMGTDLHLAAVEATTLVPWQATAAADFVQIRHGGGGAATRFVCGYLACDRLVCRPLLDAVPHVIRLSVGDGVAAALMRELLKVAVMESLALHPGAGSTLAKISELMFVEAIRRYVATLPPDRKGWLAGIRDPKVGRALALIHQHAGRQWTVDELAAEVAGSRGASARRSTEWGGKPPMQYLLRWRLALAGRMLRTTTEPIVRVASQNGYDSVESFSRAFKREFGQPPAAWRRRP